MRSITVLLLLSFFVGCEKTENGNNTLVKVIPLAPSDLAATLVSGTKIKLDWVDKSTNEDGFKIERKTGSAVFSVTGLTAKNTTTYTDSGLVLGSTYTYRVYAYNSVGASLTYTNEVTLTTIGIPVLTTTSISDTTAKTALSGGLISSDGGSPITTRGIVWGTAPNPSIALSTKTNDGSGTGSFSSKITGLTANTKYYARAYATNSAGTAYGNELTFTSNSIDLLAGLLAYYPFNGNANDESGNGNHGNQNSITPTEDRYGNINKAFLFDKIDSYVDIRDKKIIGSGNSARSIFTWIKTNDNTNYVRILSAGNPSPGEAFNFLLMWNGTPVFMGFHPYDFLPNSGLKVTDGKWHLVGITYSNNELKIWVDGKLQNSTTINLNTIGNQNFIGYPNEIGNYGVTIDHRFKGSMDDFRFYDRAISVEEIQYLFLH